jgi:hypothetical protein
MLRCTKVKFFKKNSKINIYSIIEGQQMIFRKIAEWITGRKRDEEKHILDKLNDRRVEQMQAPYKAEPPKAEPTHVVISEMPPVVAEMPAAKPEPAKCGCGRSPTGFCVGLHKLTAEEWSVHADNPSKVELKKAEPAKKPTAKKEPAKKPAVKKAPAKKPVAKKEPAKKPAGKKKAEPVVQPAPKASKTKKSKV